MNHRRLLLTGLSLGCLAALSATAHAAPPAPDLKEGAVMGEVLTAWGAPQEKIEQESHRREVWRYPKGATVVFREGKVVHWVHSTDVLSRRAAEAAREIEETEPVVSASNPDTRDLVREIAKEVPSGPDVAVPDAPEPNPPSGAPGFVPNSVPQAQPGLVPGVQVVQPDDD